MQLHMERITDCGIYSELVVEHDIPTEVHAQCAEIDRLMSDVYPEWEFVMAGDVPCE